MNKSKKILTQTLYYTCIILYLILIGLWITVPEEYVFNLYLSGLSAILTVITIYLKKDRFKAFYLSSKFRGLISAMMSAFFIFCILGLINYLSLKNPMQWDGSRGKRHTLSEYTVNVLDELKGDLHVKIFAGKKDLLSLTQLLNLYQLHHNSFFIESIDIELRPQQAKLHKIRKSGTILFSFKNNKQYVEDINEKNITDALKRLVREKDPIIYFTKSHGEIDLYLNENEGGSSLLDFLTKTQAAVKTVSGLSQKNWPKDIDLLVIWGPRLEFSDQEIELLDLYLKKSGHLMVALDPNFNQVQSKKLRAFLRKWGIEVRNDIIIDKSSHITGSNGTIPLVANFNSQHSITKKFKGPLFFPLVSSLAIIKGKVKGKFYPLAQSEKAPYSWSEKSADEFFNDNILFNEGHDEGGPQVMVLGYEGFHDEKIIVFGNSGFVTNTYAQFHKHFLFLLNSMMWEIEGDSMLSFHRPAIDEGIVFVGKNQIATIFYGSVLLLPVLLLLASFSAYRRKMV